MKKDLLFNDQYITKGKWMYSDSLTETFCNADAAVFLTEWGEFESLNWKEISSKMRKPSWVFDTLSIVNMAKVKDIGINIWQVGYGN
tara:strand:- start:217 stop:477 length:261 start_codon:yes stop_codon:yes gene_type:complete